jgi:hypothetical protein
MLGAVDSDKIQTLAYILILAYLSCLHNLNILAYCVVYKLSLGVLAPTVKQVIFGRFWS